MGRNRCLPDWHSGDRFFEHLDLCRGLSGSSVHIRFYSQTHLALAPANMVRVEKIVLVSSFLFPRLGHLRRPEEARAPLRLPGEQNRFSRGDLASVTAAGVGV